MSIITLKKAIDTDGAKLIHDDTVAYTDTKHNLKDIKGKVRYNGISDVYEVIAEDIQSGWFLSEVTNVKKQ